MRIVDLARFVACKPVDPAVWQFLQAIEEEAARTSFVWILGEFGQNIQDAPYVLEEVAADVAQEGTQMRSF